MVAGGGARSPSPALMIENEYPLDQRESLRGFLYL
jgi:hypothetical protein